jgi:hypothetical protein
VKPNLNLPNSVEERLRGWIRIQEAGRPERAKSRPRPTVTISRQFGCEGFPLAVRLQEVFNQATGEPWTIFDKELLARVAQDEHISPQVLSHLEDPMRFLEDFGFHPRGLITGDEAYAKLAAHLLHFAQQGNALIVGQGGAIICRNLNNCFHFRLEAERDWRLRSLADRMGISLAEAGTLEKSSSRSRDHYIREHLNSDVSERTLYDAVFNNERHSVNEIAAAIQGYVKAGWKGE